MKPIQKKDVVDRGKRIQLVLPQVLRATMLDTVLGAGMSALMALLEEERTELCGPRYAHDAERQATRAGYAKSELAMGGRRVSICQRSPSRIHRGSAKQIQLSFAKHLVATEGKKLLVKNEAEWTTWVKSLEPAIAAHVKDPTKLDTIFGKFVAAMHAPTGDLVQRAFGSAISLLKEVVEEIRKRNYPAHGFMMNSDGRYDVDRDVHRLEMIQTLMMALVALHVGYSGPLKGYDLRDDGGRYAPAWWPEHSQHEVDDEQCSLPRAPDSGDRPKLNLPQTVRLVQAASDATCAQTSANRRQP